MVIYKSLGNDYKALGDPETAIGYFQKALALTDHLDEERQRGLALWGLGQCYKATGKYELAKESYQHALATFEQDQESDKIIWLQAMLWQARPLLSHPCTP